MLYEFSYTRDDDSTFAVTVTGDAHVKGILPDVLVDYAKLYGRSCGAEVVTISEFRPAEVLECGAVTYAMTSQLWEGNVK